MRTQHAGLELNLSQVTSERKLALERAYVFEREKDRLGTELSETLEELQRTRNSLAQATTISDESQRIRNLYMNASIERDTLKQSLRAKTQSCEELQAKVRLDYHDGSLLRSIRLPFFLQLSELLQTANICSCLCFIENLLI